MNNFKACAFMFFILMVSCTKHRQETRYAIQNNTDFDITFIAFPKTATQLYHFDKIKEISKGKNASFYLSQKMSSEPSEIMLATYDSIQIILKNNDSTTILFSPNQVKNYKINLFSNSKFWKLNSFIDPEKSNFSTTKIDVDEYIFEINRDSIINYIK